MSSGDDPATLDVFSKETAGGSSEDVVLEGQLSGTSAAQDSPIHAPGFNTLDEPIKDTILRDVRAVGNKFYHVLYPIERASLLKVHTRENSETFFLSLSVRHCPSVTDFISCQ